MTSVRVPSSPVSGATHSKGRDQRPGFDAMHKDAARRRFDVVMAWSVDRLGRSLQDLCGFLSELHSLGIDLFLHQQGIDTTRVRMPSTPSVARAATANDSSEPVAMRMRSGCAMTPGASSASART